MPMLQLASRILERANQNGRGVTNLHLQQILYFTLIDEIKQNLLNEASLSTIYADKDNFQVWPYGPVERNVYIHYKPFGSNYIIASKTCEYSQFQKLNKIIDELIEIDVFSLIEESCTHPFWQASIRKIKNKETEEIRYAIQDLIANAKFQNFISKDKKQLKVNYKNCK